jgi:molybdenum cofactor cytidylyltransferase
MTGPIPAILLAAGGSTRMGRTKQLLPYRGRTLVWHAANELVAGGFSPTIIVTGNDSAAVSAAIADLPVAICHHADWQQGIGSSLRAGLQFARTKSPCAPAVLIALADQPGVSADHLAALLMNASSTHIAASVYAGSPGVPAIFPAKYFDALQALPDDAGAKSLLFSETQFMRSVVLNSADDIDSAEDFAALLSRESL